MGVPDFIGDLRHHIGHDLLLLAGVTAVVIDDRGWVLLTHRVDTGQWALPSGIPEPGEQLASACAREVREETGVTVEVDQLLSVWTQAPLTYPNGDRCQFIDHTFSCHPTAGTAHVADDESIEVSWRSAEDLLALSTDQRQAVGRAQTGQLTTWFAR